MDDEDEVRDLNLSSRPLREDRRKVRERERLERGMARSQQMAAEGGGSGGEGAMGGRSPSRNGSWTVNGTSKTLAEEQGGSRRESDSRSAPFHSSPAPGGPPTSSCHCHAILQKSGKTTSHSLAC